MDKPDIGTVLVVTDHLSESDAIVLAEVAKVPGNGEYKFNVVHDKGYDGSRFAVADADGGSIWAANVEWLNGPKSGDPEKAGKCQ